MLSGIKLDHKGEITYFGKFTEKDRDGKEEVKNRIGYVSAKSYYLPNWTAEQIIELSEMLFSDFSKEEFLSWCDELALFEGGSFDGKKKVSSFSDGNQMKFMLANVLSRKADLLLLDEPASPLDPLMRDKLNSMIREYISKKEGNTVFFSTHNISDMETVADYAIIMAHGKIAEEGFVEDLKEKYTYVKGDKKDEELGKKYMYDMTTNNYGFEGLCLSDNLDKLAGADIITETPTLTQLSVGIMRANTRLKLA
jgi:ABC-2 type transport system ATP-binding protein